MSLSAQDIDFARELFHDIPGLSTRKMFGGLGLYSGAAIFALMRKDGQLLLKARDSFAQTLAAQGSVQWTTERKNGTQSAMPYWTLPEAALDDPSLACDLARQALSELE